MNTNEDRATETMDTNERATMRMETNEERGTATVDLFATISEDTNKEVSAESMDTIKERVEVSTNMNEESEREEEEELPSLVNIDTQVPEAVQELSTGANETHVTFLHTDERDEEEEEEEELPCVVNTDTCVLEAVQGLTTRANDISITFLPTDDKEEQLISEFMSSGCGCSKIKEKSCIDQFSLDHVKALRSSCAELTHEQLDMLLFGQALSFMHNSSTTHREGERKKDYCSVTHLGKPVCFRTFKFLHGIGRKRWRNVIASFKMHGIAPRVHSNTRKSPKHALSFSSIEYVVRFLFSYAEEHALLLP